MRLIDADAANVEDIVCFYGDSCQIECVKEWLDEQPTIDAEPVRHGRWKLEPYLTVWYGPGEPPEWECTQCRERAYNTYDYCPNCGAKMDGGTPDENA